MLSETFLLRHDAEAWARRVECEIDNGKTPTQKNVAGIKTFGGLIDLHLADMKSVGKEIGRSKAFSMVQLKKALGSIPFESLDRERIIQFGRARADEDAGPATLSIDIGYIRTILSHAAAIHGIPTTVEHVDMARIALSRLGLVGKGKERDRRPTDGEIVSLLKYFQTVGSTCFPMDRIICFAIATAMRQEEICRVTWADLTPRMRTLTIRDRKDPKEKRGNHQTIPLLSVSGYDAWKLIEEQRRSADGNHARIFPYNGKSVGTAFRRACKALGIEDLHFHDFRHEGTSRLFEAGFEIPQVALVTGHKDWKMLKRYTHLRPQHLHIIAKSLPAQTSVDYDWDGHFGEAGAGQVSSQVM
ncbi:MAG: site-specific integrase [Asticcacaulis sp.]|nr:site-specific integrase [Asticcacaulis sp.]